MPDDQTDVCARQAPFSGTRIGGFGLTCAVAVQKGKHSLLSGTVCGLQGAALDTDAPFGGEVVVFAVVYYPGIKDAVWQYGDRLAGKVVVDITNPVDTQTWDRLATAPGSSSAEEVAGLVPDGTPVVKAFNTTFAPTLVDGEVSGQPLDVLIAGDDETAKQKVSQLVSDAGLRPLDVGPLNRAQQLEHLGLLHITLQQPHGLGFGSAIKLLA